MRAGQPLMLYKRPTGIPHQSLSAAPASRAWPRPMYGLCRSCSMRPALSHRGQGGWCWSAASLGSARLTDKARLKGRDGGRYRRHALDDYVVDDSRTLDSLLDGPQTFQSMADDLYSRMPDQPPQISWPALVVAACALIVLCYYDRPRGWAARHLIEARDSLVDAKGVFARTPLKRGTVLGAYPGRVRSEADMVDKATVVPVCRSYVFKTTSGQFMDPTDATGLPSSRPGPGMPWLTVDPLLAFVNEPPPGYTTNVMVEDGLDDREICFVAAADIEPNEELFIDYGFTYDRSGYGGN